MKNFNPLLSCSVMLCATLVLFSCKKQISEPIEEQTIASSQAANASQCRPAILGVYSVNPSNPAGGEWTTLAQKWYSNGRVKYLKAKHAGYTGTVLDPSLESFDLNWGELSYQGNQVYLTDVSNNRMSMRVTLDNLGRPIASYYYNDASADNFLHDTTYYYYNGGRLEYMISLFKTTLDAPVPHLGWRKFKFSYDSWGNLIKAEFPGSLRLNIQYDYTKPVTGIINNFQLTSSLKLLEYMELIKLPMHHAVTSTNLGTILYSYSPNELFSEIFHSNYKDYVITNGLVQSYVYDDPHRVVTFYNGWDCGTGPSMSVTNKPGNAFTNLNQFQQLYPNQY